MDVNEALQECAIPDAEPRLLARKGELFLLGPFTWQLKVWVDKRLTPSLLLAGSVGYSEHVLRHDDDLVVELLEIESGSVVRVIVVLHSDERGQCRVHHAQLRAVRDAVIVGRIEEIGAGSVVVWRVLHCQTEGGIRGQIAAPGRSLAGDG